MNVVLSVLVENYPAESVSACRAAVPFIQESIFIVGHQNAADCTIALSAISGCFSTTSAAAYPPSEPPAIVRASAVSGHVLFRSFATEAAHSRR